MSLPSLQTSPELIALRQRAAKLLEDVLDERISPQLAINRWPEAGELPDPSLEIAYQALWHFEADEDKQQSEVFYLDAQIELLRQMAVFLKDGRELPAYFLKGYSPDHTVRFFYDRTVVEDSSQVARSFWLEVRRIWQTALELANLEHLAASLVQALKHTKKLLHR